ncbi:MAG: eCIS core domain-containing protein [Anaerolineales bacterium]
MSAQTFVPAVQDQGAPSKTAILQRSCACGQHNHAGGECESCKKKRVGLQRSPLSRMMRNDREDGQYAPPIVHEVLRSPGQPLDRETRQFMEPRFGHDFSLVRVHTDTKASDSAQAVNAHAYTSGSDIVFNRGQYRPAIGAGKWLLSHELTHVIQQSSASSIDGPLAVSTTDDAYEREAGRAADQIMTEDTVNRPQITPVRSQVSRQIQRYSFGSGTGPDFGGGRRFVEVPDEQRARVEAALGIVSRVVNNPRDYPACPRFFTDNCPGGSATALTDAFNRAVIWFQDGAPPTVGATTAGLGGQDVGYTALLYRIGRWALAASFLHEFMHICGQGDHDIGDQAKEACGRLPDIIQVSPAIEISNPIR